MRIKFFASAGKGREEAIAYAMGKGCRGHGDSVQMVPSDSRFIAADPEVDVACAFGVKGHTKTIRDAYVAAGKRFLMFDKAFIRVPGGSNAYFRVTIDGPSPNPGLMRSLRPLTRLQALRVELQPRVTSVKPDSTVIYAGSSQKYCDWHGLGDANDYAESVIRACRKWTGRRKILYRPKPTWPGFREIPGTTLAREGALTDLLGTCHVLVTHGSSAAVDAIVYGVPAITLGDCAASPVAGHHPAFCKVPIWPSDHNREHWLANLAWWQWTVDEMASGQAWEFLKRELAA